MLSLFLPLLSHSQTYHVRLYSENDGMATSTVHDITQDALGQIWMATRMGVSCYDGVTWKNYSASDGLSPQSYLGITADNNGKIWALTSSGNRTEINYFDPSGWKSIEPLKGEHITNHNLSAFLVWQDQSNDDTVIVIGCQTYGLFIWKDKKWHRIDDRSGLPHNNVYSVVALGKQYYVATQRGLSVIDTSGNLTIKSIKLGQKKENLSDQSFLALTVEIPGKFPGLPFSKPRIWALGHQWLGWFYAGENNFTRFPISPLDTDGVDYKIKLLADYHGGIFIGTYYALYYFNYQTRALEPFGRRNGLAEDGCTSLFLDFEKNIWIGTERGVSKIASRRFANYRRRQGFLEDEVASIIEYQPGKFLLGHSHGVTFWEPNKQEFKPFPFPNINEKRLATCRVIDVAMDSKKNIWMALLDAGLAKFDSNGHFTWFGNDPGFSHTVNSICIDREDRLWMAGSDSILIRYPGPGNLLSCPMTPFSGEYIRKLFSFNGNIQGVATFDSGVWVRRSNSENAEWRNYRLPGRHNANNVYAIAQGPNDQFLVGTLDGLYVTDTTLKTLKRPELTGLSIFRPVYFILTDSQQNYWFGTDNGVIRWSQNKSASNFSLNQYSLSEGLIGQETNRAAGVAASNGNILIGTNRGLSVYRRQFDDSLSWNPPPQLHLNSLEVNNNLRIPLNPFQPLHPLRLGSGIHTLVFQFRGISFRDEDAIRFTYKLEGNDQDWVHEQYPYRQKVRYSNLRPGKYNFYIKARNASGVWSSVVESPQLIISKPFYNRWWFYFLLFNLILILMYAVFHFFSQKRLAKLLAQQVQERTGQLQNVEEQYRKLFEESKDAVFVSTPQGKILDMNPAGLQLFGFKSKAEMLALTSVDSIYYRPDNREDFRKAIETNGYVKDYEINYKGREGEKIVTQVTATAVEDKDGKIVAYRGIIRDFTEKKRLEQQLVQAQKMEAIGTLAGGIAHDFNNILGVILGYSELIIEDLPSDSTLRQNAQHIMTAAGRASELVKQILAFSRQSEQERKPLRVAAIITEALKLLRSSLPTTIEIRRYIIAENAMILADATQIHQIIMNLSTNAAHAMRKGGGILEVSLEEVSINSDEEQMYQCIKPGIYVRLSVSDTGHGIPKFVMKRIFEPYFTTKETGEGTGMGLAMIHGIVKSYGGDISVFSEPGKGSVFHVFFPKYDGQKDETCCDPSQEMLPTGAEKVLLIDDEVSLVEVTIQMIQRLGYQVKSMGNPIEAVREIKRNPYVYDIVITDLTMPKMTGLQVAKEIKKINPDIPVILCSGFSSAISDQNDQKYIDDFIMKPIIKSQMACMIRKTLDKKKKKTINIH